MRLMPKEIAAIDLAARECFAPRSMVRLFGSRLDVSRRGGDIDLLIEPPLPLKPQELVERRTRFIARLYRVLGERQIDARLEKLGYLDVNAWLRWRETRNRLAHEYPDHPETRFAAIQAAIAAARSGECVPRVARQVESMTKLRHG